jgi:hypothetical protein
MAMRPDRLGCRRARRTGQGEVIKSPATQDVDRPIYDADTSIPRRAKGFLGNVTVGLRGVYHGVSRRWLQAYLNEYAWRYSKRPSGSRYCFSERSSPDGALARDAPTVSAG